MRFIIAALISFIFTANSNIYSQHTQNSGHEKISDLKEKILNLKNVSDNISIPTVSPVSKKSPALALLLSFILPGAGHFYINRMDVGKYFLGADAASWIGLASLSIYGNDVRDEARTFSKQHAGLNNLDKTDDYFADIGNFDNIYEYNNDKLTRGQYGLLYDINKFYWSWDDTKNKNIYEAQRKSSERVLNTRIVFGSILITNRIISGISALLLANKGNKKSSSLNIQPELLYKNDYSFDGVKINLSKQF
ncbi:MAG: hypothetical protein ABIY50_12420 [Ignavibacteria bacterium]